MLVHFSLNQGPNIQKDKSIFDSLNYKFKVVKHSIKGEWYFQQNVKIFNKRFTLRRALYKIQYFY